MNKSFIFLIIAIGIMIANSNVVFAQTQTDSIIIQNNRVFMQNDTVLNINQILEITQSNSEAYNEIQSAKSTGALASVLGGAGGFMIGWPLGTAIAGGDPNWLLVGIGAGVVLLSIPISISAKKQMHHGVDIYNAGLHHPPTTAHRPVQFNLGVNSNGFGLVMTF